MLKAVNLQLASAAQQRNAVCEWCCDGDIYKNAAGHVGVAMVDPDENAEIKLMWSSDGLGTISAMLKAARLQKASAEDQQAAREPQSRLEAAETAARKAESRLAEAMEEAKSSASAAEAELDAARRAMEEERQAARELRAELEASETAARAAESRLAEAMEVALYLKNVLLPIPKRMVDLRE